MAVIAETNPALTYPMMFVIGAIVAAASLVLVVVKWRADLPAAVAAEASERR